MTWSREESSFLYQYMSIWVQCNIYTYFKGKKAKDISHEMQVRTFFVKLYLVTIFGQEYKTWQKMASLWFLECFNQSALSCRIGQSLFTYILVIFFSCSYKSIGRFCGRKRPSDVISPGSCLKMVFHSNSAVAGRGFKARLCNSSTAKFGITSQLRVIFSGLVWESYHVRSREITQDHVRSLLTHSIP